MGGGGAPPRGIARRARDRDFLSRDAFTGGYGRDRFGIDRSAHGIGSRGGVPRPQSLGNDAYRTDGQIDPLGDADADADATASLVEQGLMEEDEFGSITRSGSARRAGRRGRRRRRGPVALRRRGGGRVPRVPKHRVLGRALQRRARQRKRQQGGHGASVLRVVQEERRRVQRVGVGPVVQGVLVEKDDDVPAPGVRSGQDHLHLGALHPTPAEVRKGKSASGGSAVLPSHDDHQQRPAVHELADARVSPDVARGVTARGSP